MRCMSALRWRASKPYANGWVYQNRRQTMFVVIAGGGRTGAQLANLLISQDHEVRVIDDRKDVLERIHRELPTESIIVGDPLELHVLELAGIQRADVMAACTTRDDVNLTLCYLGRTQYNVRRTIARVNNPRD